MVIRKCLYSRIENNSNLKSLIFRDFNYFQNYDIIKNNYFWWKNNTIPHFLVMGFVLINRNLITFNPNWFIFYSTNINQRIRWNEIHNHFLFSCFKHTLKKIIYLNKRRKCAQIINHNSTKQMIKIIMLKA